MLRRIAFSAGMLGALAAAAAEAPATRPSVPPLMPALEGRFTGLDAAGTPLAEVMKRLAQEANINLVVNWAALARAGVTRETPVTVHLRNLSLKDVLRTLLLAVPARETTLNYSAEDNVVEVTTNAQIARGMVTRLYDITPLLLDPLNAAPSDEAVAEARQTLHAFLSSTLANEGEPVPEKGLTIDGNFLAAVASLRGQGIVRRTVALLTHPTPPEQIPQVAAVSVAERRAKEALAGVAKKHPLQELTAALVAGKGVPAEAEKMNFILLPGAAAGKADAALAARVTPAGVVCIGTAGEVDEPLVSAVFDTRDILRRLAARSRQRPVPLPEDFFPEIQRALTAKLPALAWDKLQSGHAGAAAYHGLLIVIAPAQTQRDLAIALRGLYKE